VTFSFSLNIRSFLIGVNPYAISQQPNVKSHTKKLQTLVLIMEQCPLRDLLHNDLQFRYV